MVDGGIEVDDVWGRGRRLGHGGLALGGVGVGVEVRNEALHEGRLAATGHAHTHNRYGED